MLSGIGMAQQIVQSAFRTVQVGQLGFVQLRSSSGEVALNLGVQSVVARRIPSQQNWYSFAVPKTTPLGYQLLRPASNGAFGGVIIDVQPADPVALGGFNPVAKGRFLLLFSSSAPSRIADLLSPEVVKKHRELARFDTSRVIIQNSPISKIMSLPGRGQVCGKNLYITGDILSSQQSPTLDALRQAATEGQGQHEDLLLVDPTTMPYPSDSSVPTDHVVPTTTEERIKHNLYMWEIIKKPSSIKSSEPPYGHAPLILVLDTAYKYESLIYDEHSTRREVSIRGEGNQIIKKLESSPFHGLQVGRLINSEPFGLAPGRDVRYYGVCAKGRCQLEKIIEAICVGVAEAVSGRKVIINMSFGSQNGKEILLGALKDARDAGVALVASAGNDDRCGSSGTACNQFPAQWFGDPNAAEPWKGGYSVGSMGLTSSIGASSNTLVSRPSVFAPGVFYLPAKEAGRAADLRLYVGSSFATPILSAALALWSECQPPGTPWPMAKNIADWKQGGDGVLNLDTMLSACK
ncbi:MULTISPECIES: S8/S53 family peptidase [Deinococcus]|uniref:S8/S53 family peptidase n=1 Tax=Deinococcus rufus TaxID=2136097 RepID=A0ABV7ZDW6_9DEIO|nr:S8/S53 family peptidase [Deinococcus sp. AB2017081]WQE96770.1 S8/S53 family peptidase [Deinococcus sp. AB2017081]